MRRIWGIVIMALLPAVGMANGAMGLGLEMWDLRYWFAYVSATIIFEAWMIGRWMKLGWGRSLWLSFLANFVTAGMCGGMGLCAVVLHYPIVGSQLNPNPFFNGVALLLVLAIPSALLEFYVWDVGGLRCSPLVVGRLKAFGRTILAHLVGVPIALAILLIPPRPYVGLEAYTGYNRRYELFQFQRDLNAYTAVKNHLPNATSIGQLIDEVPNSSDSHSRDEDFWATLYLPKYGRFDLGETKRHPYELNTSISGKKVNSEAGQDEQKFIWYLRPKLNVGQTAWGIEVDPVWGDFRKVRYPDGFVPNW